MSNKPTSLAEQLDRLEFDYDFDSRLPGWVIFKGSDQDTEKYYWGDCSAVLGRIEDLTEVPDTEEIFSDFPRVGRPVDHGVLGVVGNLAIHLDTTKEVETFLAATKANPFLNSDSDSDYIEWVTRCAVSCQRRPIKFFTIDDPEEGNPLWPHWLGVLRDDANATYKHAVKRQQSIGGGTLVAGTQIWISSPIPESGLRLDRSEFYSALVSDDGRSYLHFDFDLDDCVWMD